MECCRVGIELRRKGTGGVSFPVEEGNALTKDVLEVFQAVVCSQALGANTFISYNQMKVLWGVIYVLNQGK